MKRDNKSPGSLKYGLTLATLLCWILPIIVVTTTAAVLFDSYYRKNIEHSTQMNSENAMRQVELRMLSVIEDSKAVSYDGVVREAYRNGGRLVYYYVTEYLNQKFTRSSQYRCVFISSVNENESIHSFACAPGMPKLDLLRNYTTNVLPATKDLLKDKDTGIYFMTVDNELYLVRNLLDKDFVPYAILVMNLEKSEVFQSLYNIPDIFISNLSIDGVHIPLSSDEGETGSEGTEFGTVVDGHVIKFYVQRPRFSVWNSVPMLRWAIFLIGLLVLPLLMLVILLFYKNINHPMKVLINANARVQSGERGYQIKEDAPNFEFKQLYHHFNSMSTELKNQFDQIYLEQQALQQAKIKALQSQINPHFLNNTLEIINLEARVAENESVCSMIEALSTMLGAAIGRDDRSRIQLSEELRYVDAYLYITKKRLGDRLTIKRDIDPDMLSFLIPRLMLQPIIENAIEHDLSRTGGELSLRVYRTEDNMGAAFCFEIEHDGIITDKGWAKIQKSLEPDVSLDPESFKGNSVGIRNVNQRLRLMYGDNYSFEILQPVRGRILAKIVLRGENGQAENKMHKIEQL